MSNVNNDENTLQNKSWGNFELILYQENYDKMLEVLESNWIKKWAYIKHDKDNKVEHIHLMCSMKPSTTKTSVIIKKFSIRINQIEKIKSSWADALDYLTHNNAPNKYQYDSSEVVSNFDWEEEAKNSKNNKQKRRSEIVEKICNGEIRKYNETDNITPVEYDLYYNSIQRAYKYRESHIIAHLEEMVKMKHIVWVYGKTGTGKTRFAKMLAKSMNLYYKMTSTGAHMFDEYQDEPCLIMDDLRPDSINFVDLLGILDPYNFKTAYARYKNKALQTEVIIVTSTLSPEQFIRGYGTDMIKQEDERQLFRRISNIYEITDDEVIGTEYDEDNIMRVVTERYPNVFKHLKEEKQSSKISNSVSNMMENLILTT